MASQSDQDPPSSEVFAPCVAVIAEHARLLLVDRATQELSAFPVIQRIMVRTWIAPDFCYESPADLWRARHSCVCRTCVFKSICRVTVVPENELKSDASLGKHLHVFVQEHCKDDLILLIEEQLYPVEDILDRKSLPERVLNAGRQYANDNKLTAQTTVGELCVCCQLQVNKLCAS